MRPLFGSLVLLLVSAALPAQITSSPAQGTAPGDLTVVQSQNCPLRLSASRWTSNGAMQRISQDAPPLWRTGIYLRTDLSTGATAVISATAIARGTTYSSRAESAGSAGTKGDRSQTFHLDATTLEANGRWKLITNQVPLVRDIELTELHLADGTHWQASAGSQCHVQPNGLLLVAGTR